MDRPSRGFTVLELIVVLFIVVTFTFTVSFKVFKQNKVNEEIKILEAQSEALLRRERINYDKNIWFNHNGNINRAQSRKINKKTCVFQLGFGRFYCE